MSSEKYQYIETYRRETFHSAFMSVQTRVHAEVHAAIHTLENPIIGRAWSNVAVGDFAVATVKDKWDAMLSSKNGVRHAERAEVHISIHHAVTITVDRTFRTYFSIACCTCHFAGRTSRGVVSTERPSILLDTVMDAPLVARNVATSVALLAFIDAL